MARPPKSEGSLKRVQSCFLPPDVFISVPMQFAMVCATYRHGELVTHLASQSSELSEPDVMGVRRRASAYEARLCRDKPEVLLIADSSRLREGEDALIDARCVGRRPYAPTRVRSSAVRRGLRAYG